MPPKKVARTKRIGRPPGPSDLLTHDLVAEIINNIEKGAQPLTAARAAGVARRTWYRWLEEAEKDTADDRLQHLWHSVEKARGRLAMRYFGTINEAALGHDIPLRDAKGNVIFEEKNGKPVPMMEHVPGNWIAAARALESLTPDEFVRNFTGGARGGQIGDADQPPTDFEIIYLTSNRDPKEMREIEKRVQERAARIGVSG
jgi:hypothetical protein